MKQERGQLFLDEDLSLSQSGRRAADSQRWMMMDRSESGVYCRLHILYEHLNFFELYHLKLATLLLFDENSLHRYRKRQD